MLRAAGALSWAVTQAEGAAGVLLCTAHRAGPALALVLLPIGLVFWIGFALPVRPVIGAQQIRGDRMRPSQPCARSANRL
jgi:hypothetical protein